MANTTRLPSHLRAGSLPSGAAGTSTASSSSAVPPSLTARIAEKKAELENLRELRDLSGQLAGQMETLEAKLATLSSGTEAVATVLGNWGAVLKSIHMASVKLPRPKEEQEGQEEGAATREDQALPQTLVRIPAQEPARTQNST